MNGWIAVFPRENGQRWFYLHNLCSVGVISEWLQENYHKTRVKALTISGGDMRKWRLSTKDKVKTFVSYLRNNVGIDNSKVRVLYKKRHATFRPQ